MVAHVPMGSIEKTGLSDECKSNLISECVSTSEEYALLVAELRREALAGSNWLSLPGTFVCYTQLEENYCVPATAQSALKYLTGITYRTDGHALCVNAITSDMGQVQMADSYMKYLDPNSSAYYQKYADTVYSAITSYGSGTGYLY